MLVAVADMLVPGAAEVGLLRAVMSIARALDIDDDVDLSGLVPEKEYRCC